MHREDNQVLNKGKAIKGVTSTRLLVFSILLAVVA
jgi:hypothetical protein